MLATTLTQILLGLAVAILCSITPAAYAHDNDTSPIYQVRNTTLVTIQDDHYGNRNVSYFVADGLAIIDGDVVYGTVEELLHHSQGSIQTSRSLPVFSTPKPWPGATLTYKFDSNTTENILKPTVDIAISRWKAGAPYLTFIQAPSGRPADDGVITITGNPCLGCYANIGFGNTPRIMNLQPNCPSAPGGCGPSEATHVFGHLLGLYHEHQRFDRDLYIRFQCINLDPGPSCHMPIGRTCCDGGPLIIGCCGLPGNFEFIRWPNPFPLPWPPRPVPVPVPRWPWPFPWPFPWPPPGPLRLGPGPGPDPPPFLLPYAINSIMEYRRDAFAKAGTFTLIPAQANITVPPITLGFPDEIDFSRICALYPTQCLKAGCESCSCGNPRKAVPLFRAYSGQATDHFYTTDKTELDSAISSGAYIDEGIAGYIFSTCEPHTVPLHRLYSSEALDHFYTTDIDEMENAINKLGYTNEGTVGYVYTDTKCSGLPLYRSYSSQFTDHFYTMLECERDNACKNFGYKGEGITGYIFPV